MKVGEVLTSKGGSTASQFVEFQDPLGEGFSNPPYSINVFNAAGTSVGSQTVTVVAGTTRLLLATAQAQTAFGVTANAILTVALPADGQLCFNNNVGRIHCLQWGTITSTIIGNTMDSGPKPTDGVSVQRTSAGYILGTPTPGAANITPPVMVDGPPLPDAGVTPDGTVRPDADTGNPNTPKDGGGCDIGGGASWFALAGLVALALVRRSSIRR